MKDRRAKMELRRYRGDWQSWGGPRVALRLGKSEWITEALMRASELTYCSRLGALRLPSP